MITILVILLAVLVFSSFTLYEVRRKNIHIWLPAYLRQCFTPKPRVNKNEPVHVVFCITDHFEPMWNRPDYAEEVRRVDAWVREYPRIAGKHADSEGRRPQYTFFYPEEEYRKEHLDKLAKLCKDGYGAVEIHLHHDNDTPEGLREKLERFKRTLRGHGLLSSDEKGTIRYGFIHGNWTLDNSAGDGSNCGVNNELQILKETGCYADFTLPSAPSDTQTRKINSIYYATDDPEKPKSHDTGIDAEVGVPPTGDLLIIQGPLTLDWRNRKWGIFPRIESGELSGENPPTSARVDLWVKQHIHVKGAPNWIFIKVYTHGCQDKNMRVILGEPLHHMFEYLEDHYNDGKTYRLHYVTARQMYDLIRQKSEEKTV